MAIQESLMRYDPATGEEKPYPSHAKQWRQYHGERTAWLFNPWTGERRDARDVGSDVTGLLVQDFLPERVVVTDTYHVNSLPSLKNSVD